MSGDPDVIVEYNEGLDPVVTRKARDEGEIPKSAFKPTFYLKVTNPAGDDIEWARKVLNHIGRPDAEEFKPRPNMKLVETDDSILQRVQHATELGR